MEIDEFQNYLDFVADVIVHKLNRQIELGDTIQNKRLVRCSCGAGQNRNVIRCVTKPIMDFEGLPILWWLGPEA